MTRFLSAPLLLICCAGPPAMQPPHKAEPAPAPAPAPVPPAPGLTVDGKYTLTVTEMPFRVLAPTGADLYFWRVPPGWTVSDNRDSLTVKAAPAGTAEVGLQTVTFDLVGKKTINSNYSLSVAVGGTPPPQPPGPGPQPPGPGPTDFAKAIQDAYRAAPDAAGKAKLALYYRAAAPLWRTVSLRPMSALYKAVADERARQGVSEATLPAVREVIGKAMTAVGVSTDPNKDVPADQREKLAKICESAVAALEGVQ
jgi:hypothetical protein